MTQDPGCPRARPTRYSTRSLRRSRKAAVWAWQSVNRSSNRTVAEFGQMAMRGLVRCSISPCRSGLQKQTSPRMLLDSVQQGGGRRGKTDRRHRFLVMWDQHKTDNQPPLECSVHERTDEGTMLQLENRFSHPCDCG